MIERVIFRDGLPQVYEITARTGDGQPIESPTVVRAQLLDDALDGTQFTREDVIFDALRQLAASEDAPDLTYSMRLMRPKETRQHWRSTLHGVIGAAFAKSITENPVYKQLIGQDTLSTVIMMQELEPTVP